MEKRTIYRFGEFSVDATAKVLLKNGEPVHLARKSVETLTVLAQNAGQVLTKEELIEAVWPNRVVDEANLTQNIAVVRRTLGVDRGSAGYIETFPGRGYRLVGPVEQVEETNGASKHAGVVAVTEAPPSARPAPLSLRWPWLAVLVIALTAAGVWIGKSWRGSEKAQSDFARVAVTRFAGKEYQPAVSPDGRKTAFVWQQDGDARGGIWVAEEAGHPPRRISANEGDYSSPAWSRDGRSLAYLHFGDESTEVLIHSLETGAERRVAHLFPTRHGLSLRHLDFSPDGALLAVDDAQGPNEPFGIFLISIETGEARRLTRPNELYLGDLEPRFSPDGKTISYIRASHRALQELFTIPVEGGEPRQITNCGKQIGGHDWMRDSRSLVFSSDRSGEYRVYTIRLDAPAPEATVSYAGIYGDFPLQLSMARDVDVLTYAELHQDFNIWRYDLAATNPRERWRRVIASPVTDASPQYSPDGQWICYRSDSSGQEQLWAARADGSEAVQITRGTQYPSVGRWSPDGRSIVYNDARTKMISVASRDPAGNWTTKETGVQAIHPVYSPDGKWLYAGGDNALLRIPAAGGEPTEVLRMRGISLGVSLRGKYIYFVRDPAGVDLWGLNIETGEARKVLEGLVPYCTSCWAVSEKGIYYLCNKGATANDQAIYYRDFATGADRLVTPYPEPLVPIGSGPFSLSPDGRYLLCVRVDSSASDVMRVQPFR